MITTFLILHLTTFLFAFLLCDYQNYKENKMKNNLPKMKYNFSYLLTNHKRYKDILPAIFCVCFFLPYLVILFYIFDNK